MWEPNDFPWVVVIWAWDSEKEKLEKVCTGALLDSTHVLTAAHCVTNTRAVLETGVYYVFLGTNHLEGDSRNMNPYASSKVSKVDLHPSINGVSGGFRSYVEGEQIKFLSYKVIKSSTTADMMTQKIGDNLIPFCEHCPGSNDVAILTLPSEIRYSNRVRLIYLPSSDVNDMGLPNNYDDEIVLAAGFGLHELNEIWNRPAQNFDLSCFGQKCPTAKNVSDTEGVTTALLTSTNVYNRCD